jgi:hypothetical protein
MIERQPINGNYTSSQQRAFGTSLIRSFIARFIPIQFPHSSLDKLPWTFAQGSCFVISFVSAAGVCGFGVFARILSLLLTALKSCDSLPQGVCLGASGSVIVVGHVPS